jgi:hypothetical protein
VVILAVTTGGGLMRRTLILTALLALVLVPALTAPAQSKNAVQEFSNTPLISTWDASPFGITSQPNANSTGNSEPAITFGADGSMAIGGLSWLPPQINLWRGSFGSTPAYFGAMDQTVALPGRGRSATGDGDEDLDIATTGTLHLADLDPIYNATGDVQSYGVSVTNCPVGAALPSACDQHLLDHTKVDRPWITSIGKTVWIAYHDFSNSALIRVVKSSDDGRTWSQSGSPINGQGKTTADSTFNNDEGPLVADPTTGNLYDVFASGTPQTKCCSADHNQIFVSRSTDGGKSWTARLVYAAPVGTALGNLFPSLTVDPITGVVYAVWSDLHGAWVSSSSDHGVTWTSPDNVASVPTVVMPTVAARNGKVDVVYYGTTASSNDDTSGVWNVYDSRFVNGAWQVELVSNQPNRIGAVCVVGDACTGNRELLDLFEAAEDPVSGKLAVVYTETTTDTWTQAGTTQELPEIVLAYQH